MHAHRLHAMVIYFPFGERGCAKRYAQIVFKGILEEGIRKFTPFDEIGTAGVEFIVSYEPSRLVPVRFGFAGSLLYPVETQEDFLNVAADDLDDRKAAWGLVVSSANISYDKHLSFIDVIEDSGGGHFDEIHVFNECHQRIFDKANKSLDEVLAMKDEDNDDFIVGHVLPWLRRDGGELEWEAEDIIDMLRSWEPGQYEGVFEARF